MFPILFKLDFATPGMQLLALLVVLLLAAYGVFAGVRGAPNQASAWWRGAMFGSAAALAAIVAACFAFPPMSSGMASAVKGVAGLLSVVLVVSAAVYGRKIADRAAATSSMLGYGVMAAVAAFLAFRFGFKEMGRGLGAPLHTYGFALALGFIVALAIAAREARRAYPEKVMYEGKSIELGVLMRDRVLDLCFYMLVGGVIGSRILFAIVNWKDYWKGDLGAFFGMLFSLTGGLVFYGGFLGAAVVWIWFCKTRKIDFLRVADVVIPSLSLGHAIGRLGCFSAGCCWGGFAKMGSRLAVQFPSADRLPFDGHGTSSLAFADQIHDNRWVDALGHVHANMVDGATQISAFAQANGMTLPVYPVQLMESMGELLLFVGLLTLRRFKRFHGQLFGTWLVGYSILRTTIEFFRGDTARGYVFRYPAVDPVMLSTSQSISLGIFLAGIAIFVIAGRKQTGAIAHA